MTRIFIISLIFVAFYLLSCKTKENNAEPSFDIAGTVVDENNNGLSGVRIYYTSTDFVITDDFGNWQILGLSEPVTLMPRKELYEFSPCKILVNSASSNISFTAYGIKINYEQQVLNWFIQLQLNNGLLPSTEGGNVVSLYDNALAAMVFMTYGEHEKVENIFNFFNERIDSEFKLGLGGFSQFRDNNGTPSNHRWMGDNAWLLIALNNYKSLTGSDKYDGLIVELNNWIINLQDEKDGGVWGGNDADGNRIHKVTEGNIDAFNAVKGYTDFHSRILNFLGTERWDAIDKNLIATSEDEKYRFAMDIHPWSYCVFENYPVSSLTTAERYLTTKLATASGNYITGYSFDVDRDAIWLEGTGEMVVAFQEADMVSEVCYYLAEMEKAMIVSSLFENSMALPYAANLETGYGPDDLWEGVDTNPAISSSAWYLFGKKGFNPFKLEKNKNIPISEQFWTN